MNTEKIMKVGDLSSSQDGIVVDDRGIAPTHTAGHGNCPKVLTRGGDYLAIRENATKGFKEAYVGDSVNLERPGSKTRRGRVGDQVAQTLTTACNQGVVTHERTIRKLTPLECFRLMGFDDEDCKILEDDGISNAQLYKMAGNSIVVNVLMAIFTNLLLSSESNSFNDNPNKNINPVCLNSRGGRNGVDGLQPSLTNRIYDSNELAVAVTTSPFFMPNYEIDKGGD